MNKVLHHIINKLNESLRQYYNFIEARLPVYPLIGDNPLVYWQRKLFIKTTAIAFPMGIMVLFPSVFVFWEDGSYWVPIIDLVSLFTILCFLIFTRYSLQAKMGVAVSILSLLAYFLIASLGSFGIGSIYLMAIAVVIALLFSDLIAYTSILINTVVLLLFSTVVDNDLVSWPLVHNYRKEIWLIYSLNFSFLNLMVVIGIRQLLAGLQATLAEEDRLLKALQDELKTKTIRNSLLAESEEHYKSLFFSNPTPMWIFDLESLLFLQVNDAAISKYGYTSEEFLQMTIDQIRVEPVSLIFDRLKDTLINHTLFSNVAIHKKKNHQQFYSKTKCNTIPFHGRQALLVIAHDITTQISHNKAINAQNEKLRNIAYYQSHMVRAPLARIKGLWAMMMLDYASVIDLTASSYMQTSIDDLDQVIKDIIKDSQIVSGDDASFIDQQDINNE